MRGCWRHGAQLIRMERRELCATCGEVIARAAWAYQADDGRLWHRSCDVPALEAPDDAELEREAADDAPAALEAPDDAELEREAADDAPAALDDPTTPGATG